LAEAEQEFHQPAALRIQGFIWGRILSGFVANFRSMQMPRLEACDGKAEGRRLPFGVPHEK